MLSYKEASQLHYELFHTQDHLACKVMWERIQDKQLPYLGELQARDELVKKDRGVVDGAAWRANQTFAGGLTNGSVPQAVNWFDFDVDSAEDDYNLKEIIAMRKEAINLAFNHSNFYSAFHSAASELAFGQSPVGTFFIPDIGMRFENYSIGSYAYALDSERNVSAFAVKKEMTVAQLVRKFGLEKLPDRLQKCFKDRRAFETKETLFWLVIRNPETNRRDIGYKGKPFLSLYWLKGGNQEKFIHEGGFDSCPIAVMPYMAIPSSVYSLGPGWFADSDVRMQHELLRQAMGNLALQVQPALQGPPGVEVDYRPGAVTELNGVDKGKVESLFNVVPVFPQVFEVSAAVEDKINAAYNVNLFSMLEQTKFDSTGRTAFELNLRQQERMQQLTPVITRLNNEFLKKIIERTYEIYERNGAFAPIPAEYDGLELNVQYVSPLAQLQKMSGIQSLEMVLATVGQVAQIKPSVLDIFKEAEYVHAFADSVGSPPKILHSVDEYEEQQQAKAEQAAKEREMMQAAQMAQPAEQYTKAAANLQEMADNPANAPLEQLAAQLRGA